MPLKLAIFATDDRGPLHRPADGRTRDVAASACRHAFATLLFDEGEELASIAAALGALGRATG